MYSTKKFPSVVVLTDIKDIESQKAEKLVTVYPNPSGNYFNFMIKTLSPSAVSIIIYDISGRPIRQIVTNVTNESVPVIWDGKSAAGTEAPSGLYLVSVKTGRRTETVKIIKN
jgi:flagellar hook assembly protein FlgD